MENRILQWGSMTAGTSHLVKVYRQVIPAHLDFQAASGLGFFEIVFSCTTYWTGPVIGNIFKGSSWSNIIIGISFGWVIHPSTNNAYVLFHC